MRCLVPRLQAAPFCSRRRRARRLPSRVRRCGAPALASRAGLSPACSLARLAARARSRRAVGDRYRSQGGVLLAPRRARREIELRACSIVLDLLALALIDRTDVEALTSAGIRASRGLREMDLPVDEPADRDQDGRRHQTGRERERHDEYLELALRASAAINVEPAVLRE
jgi:hypothetical protein